MNNLRLLEQNLYYTQYQYNSALAYSWSLEEQIKSLMVTIDSKNDYIQQLESEKAYLLTSNDDLINVGNQVLAMNQDILNANQALMQRNTMLYQALMELKPKVQNIISTTESILSGNK